MDEKELRVIAGKLASAPEAVPDGEFSVYSLHELTDELLAEGGRLSQLAYMGCLSCAFQIQQRSSPHCPCYALGVGAFGVLLAVDGRLGLSGEVGDTCDVKIVARVKDVWRPTGGQGSLPRFQSSSR